MFNFDLGQCLSPAGSHSVCYSGSMLPKYNLSRKLGPFVSFLFLFFSTVRSYLPFQIDHNPQIEFTPSQRSEEWRDAFNLDHHGTCACDSCLLRRAAIHLAPLWLPLLRRAPEDAGKPSTSPPCAHRRLQLMLRLRPPPASLPLVRLLPPAKAAPDASRCQHCSPSHLQCLSSLLLPWQ